jgi:Tfp pilus assembly protein PilV
MRETKNKAQTGRPRRFRCLATVGGECGVGLVEALVAVAILGIALTALLSAVSTGSMAVSRTEERVTAENLARSQLEYVKSQPYQLLPATYALITPSPDDYDVGVVADAVPGGDSGLRR